MNPIIALYLLALACLTGCASTEEQNETTESDTSSLNPISPHYTKGAELGKREPKEDAEAFFTSGYAGYIMTTGGVVMPIGVKNFSDEEYYSESILDFKIPKNSELAHIQALLTDLDGPLTLSELKKGISSEREYYLEVTSAYSRKFNQRMENLITKQERTSRSLTIRQEN
ncbi:MAG: hypothetical protein AAF546_09090 [Verrucomicrobiota bacterium]